MHVCHYKGISTYLQSCEDFITHQAAHRLSRDRGYRRVTPRQRICICRVWRGWHCELWETGDVSRVSRDPWSPHGVVMIWRERVTHEGNQLPSILQRLSHLSPIISPPAHLYWHEHQLTATYITLTNKRLRGLFASHLQLTPIPVLVRCPLQLG